MKELLKELASKRKIETEIKSEIESLKNELKARMIEDELKNADGFGIKVVLRKGNTTYSVKTEHLNEAISKGYVTKNLTYKVAKETQDEAVESGYAEKREGKSTLMIKDEV